MRLSEDDLSEIRLPQAVALQGLAGRQPLARPYSLGKNGEEDESGSRCSSLEAPKHGGCWEAFYFFCSLCFSGGNPNPLNCYNLKLK